MVAGTAASGCPRSGAGVARGDGLAEAPGSCWMKWMPGTVTSALIRPARRGRCPGTAPPAAAVPRSPGSLLYLSQGCLQAAAHGAPIEVSVPIAPTLGRVSC